MSKISIDKRTIGERRNDSDIPDPTPKQVMQAFKAALLTTLMMGKAEELLEVITTHFDYVSVEIGPPHLTWKMRLCLTAIMHDWLDEKGEKFKASVEIDMTEEELSPIEISKKLCIKIEVALLARSSNKASDAQDLRKRWQSLIETSAAFQEADKICL